MNERAAAGAAAWNGVAAGFAAHALVLPGDPGFRCQAQECRAWCCHALTVALGEEEVDRLASRSGRPPAWFLESEHGEPLALPLAQPFVLARDDGHCRLLAEDLSCAQYDGRPQACRAYPFQAVFASRGSGLAAWPSAARARAAVAVDPGEADLVPLLLRHRDCPGFTGDPIADEEWAHLLEETVKLLSPAGEERLAQGRQTRPIRRSSGAGRGARASEATNSHETATTTPPKAMSKK